MRTRPLVLMLIGLAAILVILIVSAAALALRGMGARAGDASVSRAAGAVAVPPRGASAPGPAAGHAVPTSQGMSSVQPGAVFAPRLSPELQTLRDAADTAFARVKDLDRGQGLGQRLDAVLELRRQAEGFLQKRATGDAKAAYAKIAEECTALARWDEDRQVALAARRGAEQAMEAAKARNAEADAKAWWSNAGQWHTVAQGAHDDGKFADATKAWQTAALEYGKAAVCAEGVARVRSAKAGYQEAIQKADMALLQRYGGEAWAKVQNASMAAESCGDQFDKACQCYADARQFLTAALRTAGDMQSRATEEAEKAKYQTQLAERDARIKQLEAERAKAEQERLKADEAKLAMQEVAREALLRQQEAERRAQEERRRLEAEGNPVSPPPPEPEPVPVMAPPEPPSALPVIDVQPVPDNGPVTWYAGTWDATNRNRSERPRTIAVRVEIVDPDRHNLIPGAEVRLRGTYLDEWIGRPPDNKAGHMGEPTERQFLMRAVTGRDGVAVFGLGWQKEYPWYTHLGKESPIDEKSRKPSGSYSYATGWRKYLDDIEKVQKIEVRCSGYDYREIAFNFRQLLDVGQEAGKDDPRSQQPEVFDRFEKAWVGEISRPDVKFCFPNFGKDFPDFGNKACKRVEFFEKLERKDFGTVYNARQNVHWNLPESGPYLVYLLQVPLVRTAGAIEVVVIRPDDVPEPPRDRRKVEEREKQRQNEGQAPSKDSWQADQQKKRAEEARQGAQKEQQQRDAESRRAEEQKQAEAKRAEQARKEAEARRQQQEQAKQEARRSGKVSIGATVRTIAPAETRRRGFQANSDYILVESVDPGSPADRAGLRAGMIITSVCNKAVSKASDFPTVGKSGDTLQIDAIGERRMLIQISDKDLK